MQEIFKLTATETGDRPLLVQLAHEPDAALRFEVVVTMDTKKLCGPVEDERWLLLAMLHEHTGLLLGARARRAMDNPR